MSANDLISRTDLYEKTAEWEAQALHMVELHMRDDDKSEWRKWSTVLAERSAFKYDVAAAPAVDAKPVVRGKWEEIEIHWYDKSEDIASMRCSNCHRYHNTVYHYGDPTENANFCPNCGADMRGKKHEDD